MGVWLNIIKSHVRLRFDLMLFMMKLITSFCGLAVFREIPELGNGISPAWVIFVLFLQDHNNCFVDCIPPLPLRILKFLIFLINKFLQPTVLTVTTRIKRFIYP